ncbi:MAG: arsenate reductase ArsC [Anaerolineales bacterium]|nr:arsenate reductase ArsC [Anaerolineales bacterium]
MTKKALILCTGNSCRSQMAEALINAKLSDHWQAYSAGTEPAGYTHPKAIQVLAELGIEHEGTSKHIADLETKDFDAVITVCDDAAENCPVWLGEGKRHHISFPDPAKAEGTEEQILAAFREVRDNIDEQVLAYLKTLV